MRTLLTQRSCVELYPPVLHQATILSDCADVVVLDAVTEYDRTDVLTPEAVHRLRVARRPSGSDVQARINGARWVADYMLAMRQQVSARPDVVIAYEPEAAAGILYGSRLPRQTRLIVQFHEIPTDDPAAGRVKRLVRRALLPALRRADLVIMPDRHRARYVTRIASLKREPVIVMNCPRRMTALPASRLIPFLRARGIQTHRVVHYQGGVGGSKSLENVIRSMPTWPSDSVFVVVGEGTREYIESLRRLAAEVGVSDRLLFVGRVPYDQVLSFAVGATVGTTLLEPFYPNSRFSAGASNKRFEYIALGIPQVTVQAPGVDETFGRTGVAVTADYTDPTSIGKNITHFLENASNAAEVGARARALHLNEYNYEHQFSPVLEWMGAAG